MKMTMNNMLKANEKIYIKSYIAYTPEEAAAYASRTTN